ncbi:MAG TPA: diguanylate cyclase [Solimonas sp.]|nr:diguanylate cyclase [Solimonas sp.]
MSAEQPDLKPPFSILLVEDSQADARLLKESLRAWIERRELTLSTVRSIAAAEQALKQGEFDCALLDLGLPDGQGLANVERVRRAAPQLAVVVLTGLDCENSAIRALQLGAQEYVVKGQYDSERLLKVLRHAAERNRQVHELEERSARQFEQASHDPITGLVNRKLFEERARQRLARARPEQRFAICFLDLDRFKAVNDRHGHAVGDALLSHIAQILRESVRDSDTLARIGGDEFAILLASIGELDQAREVGERIVERIRAITDIDGHPVAIGGSIGIAQYPEHGQTLEELLRHSDTAMYRAKSGGGGVLSLRDEATPDAAGVARFASDAEEALVSGGFEIHFQPWLDYGLGEVAGVEALLRWRRPEGLLLPAEFLPLLERGGHMPAIGLELARRAAGEWRRWQGAELTPGRLALNLSGAELMAEGQPQRLREVLAGEGVSVQQVQLEVDATVLGSADGRLFAPLQRFSDAGFTMVLEGFLPGKGDLHALASPALHGVKVDRRLLRTARREGRDSTSGRFLVGLLAAATALQLEVFLTGIEAGEELEGLDGLDFRYVQGYWPCPPLAPVELVTYLRDGPRRRRPAMTAPETPSQ